MVNQMEQETRVREVNQTLREKKTPPHNNSINLVSTYIDRSIRQFYSQPQMNRLKEARGRKMSRFLTL